jgi:hypothetical protein
LLTRAARIALTFQQAGRLDGHFPYGPAPTRWQGQVFQPLSHQGFSCVHLPESTPAPSIVASRNLETAALARKVPAELAIHVLEKLHRCRFVSIALRIE